MAVEVQRVAAFVFDALKNDATFAAAVGGRIYRDLVPQASAFPAATVALVPATDTNTLGGNRVFSLAIVDVRLIAAGSSYAPINAAADRADAILQGLDGSNGGVVVVKLRRDQPTPLVETDAGATFTHLIQTYRTECYSAP